LQKKAKLYLSEASVINKNKIRNWNEAFFSYELK
jgi:hypothetical protein